MCSIADGGGDERADDSLLQGEPLLPTRSDFPNAQIAAMAGNQR